MTADGCAEDMTTPAAVARALALDECGIQISAMLGRTPILDGWGGALGDGARTPVDAETLFPIFSVSKAVTAVAVHIQAERGLIEYDAPLAAYWPEYGARGKESVTVGHVLSHRAGVPQMPDDVTPERMCDWNWMVERLADAEPLFPAGTRNA